jgi:hypothetical protein
LVDYFKGGGDEKDYQQNSFIDAKYQKIPKIFFKRNQGLPFVNL